MKFEDMNVRVRSSVFDSFEKEEAILSNVEVNIVIGLVSDVRAEISTNKGVPVSVVLSIEFVFEVSRNLLDCMHLI